ncbi:MAG TPA: multiheme c-type cytochrome [Candidatus Deferrimicrobiaceae bacterium]
MNRTSRPTVPVVTLAFCLMASAALALLCVPSAASAFGGPGAKGFAGSERCEECHDEIYNQWILTPHANMLRDAKKNRKAVAAIDFSRVPFKRKDINWSIGSHWVQKYLTRIDNDYFVLPKVWNLVADDWEPYSMFNWREKPYTIWCDGCHTTGFDPETKSFTEPSIGCESCHGPGDKHAKSQAAADIVNPAKLPKDRADMICEQCHTDGKDTKAGGQFPFPANYRPGNNIDDFYTNFFAPKPKSNRWYWGSMDYLERHRMFMFWQSKFYSTARACDVCGFDRGASGPAKAERYMSRDEYCGTCHQKILKISKLHSRHDPSEAECIDCHPASPTKDGKRYSIHDHKFDFSGPELECSECHDLSDKTDRYYRKPGYKHEFHFTRLKYGEPMSMEDACKKCHPDKDAAQTLSDWKNASAPAGR